MSVLSLPFVTQDGKSSRNCPYLPNGEKYCSVVFECVRLPARIYFFSLLLSLEFTPAAIILISHLLLQMKTTIVHNRDNDVLWHIQKCLLI